MLDHKQTILIVDDEPLNIQLLAQWLSPAYRILTATSAEQALEITSKQQPDLILLDIVMPGIDGHEACRLLKNNDETVNIPIIFMTGERAPEDEAKGLELGALDYITKPFNQAIVVARTKNQLLLKEKTDLLEQLISVDGLTEIPNRRYFDQHYFQEWRRALRNKQPLSIFMCDIDYFKAFNDFYGHAVGDDCLRKVARFLSDSAQRAGEFVARYGGEEFVAVLPNCDVEQASGLAAAMVKNVESLKIPHTKSNVSEYVTISIGVAVQYPDGDSKQTELMLAADKELYSAKNAGKNRFSSIKL